MTQKVALHSREQDFLPKLAYFQASRHSLAEELVVCFDLFVRSFYENFTMLVAEAHQGLRPPCYLGYGQSAVIQGFSHIKEYDGVHDVAQDFPSHRVHRPFGKRQQAQVFLAGLDDTLDVRTAEVVGEEFRRREVLVGEQHEVAEPHRQPVLLLVPHRGVLVGMVQHEVALPLERVVLVDIHVGIYLLAEQLDLLPLAEIHMPSPDETVLPLAKGCAELMVERLEREALAGGHPADELLLRSVVEGVDDLLGNVSRIKDEGAYGDVQADSHVIHHGHDGADVQHVAGDDAVPYRHSRALVEDQHEACLDGGGLHAVAAQRVEGIVVDVVRERRGVDIAAPAEVRMLLAHHPYEGLEEVHPRAVLAHHREIGRVAAERRGRDAVQDVRGEGLLHETIACNPVAVAQDTVEDVAEHALQASLIREGCLQDACHPRFHEETHQQVCVTENSVDLRLRKDGHIAGHAAVIPADLVEGVGHGIVGHKAALRGKEYAGLAVGTEPHDLAEPLPDNLPGMVLAAVLDVSGLLDGGTAAEDIAVGVSDQFLNSYERHVDMFDLIVLSSTTKLVIYYDMAKLFNNNFTINQTFSKSSIAA